MTRNAEITASIWCVKHLMETLGIQNLEITYKEETEASVAAYPSYIIDAYGILPCQEYIYVRNSNGTLLKAINVTGDSVLYAVSDLMRYLAREFG